MQSTIATAINNSIIPNNCLLFHRPCAFFYFVTSRFRH